MKKTSQTYTTKEMLKFINNAGLNLLIRKRKTAIESKIHQQTEEIEYLREIASVLEEKLSGVDPEIKEAYAKVDDLQRTYSTLQGKQEGLKAEINQLEEIKKKADELSIKAAELSRLLAEKYSLQQSLQSAKSKHHAIDTNLRTLTQRHSELQRQLQALRAEISDKQIMQKQLIDKLSSFDIEHYLSEVLQRLEGLEIAFNSKEYRTHISKELEFVSMLFVCANAVDNVHRLLHGASQEVLNSLSALKRLKEAGKTDSLRQRTKDLAQQFAKLTGEDVHRLESENKELLQKVSDTRQRLSILNKTLAETKQSLIQETEFKDNAQALITRLQSDIQDKQRLLAQHKAELNSFNVNIELNEAFVEALKPLNDELAKVNNLLLQRLIQYKEAFQNALASLNKLQGMSV